LGFLGTTLALHLVFILGEHNCLNRGKTDADPFQSIWW